MKYIFSLLQNGDHLTLAYCDIWAITKANFSERREGRAEHFVKVKTFFSEINFLKQRILSNLVSKQT